MGEFSKLRQHYSTEYELSGQLFTPATRSLAVTRLYTEAALPGELDKVGGVFICVKFSRFTILLKRVLNILKIVVFYEKGVSLGHGKK